MAVLPSARGTRNALTELIPRRPSRPAWLPAGSRRLHSCVQTHAAPSDAVVLGPPTMAVLPSAERATESLDSRCPTAPEPTSLAPCWVQTPPLLVQTHAAPALLLSRVPSDDGRVAVGRERHGIALSSVPHGARADQLASLLAPDASAPRPDPRGPDVAVVPEPSDDGGVAVGGEGHGIALLSVPHGARADQLASLLGPDAAAPRQDPRRRRANRCPWALRRWRCCRRRRPTRNGPVEPPPWRPCRPTSGPCWTN